MDISLQRFEELEQKVARWRAATILLAAIAGVFMILNVAMLIFLWPRSQTTDRTTTIDRILRVKGLLVANEQGRDVIALGPGDQGDGVLEMFSGNGKKFAGIGQIKGTSKLTLFNEDGVQAVRLFGSRDYSGLQFLNDAGHPRFFAAIAGGNAELILEDQGGNTTWKAPEP